MYFSHRFILLLRKKPTNIKHPIETRILVLLFTFIYGMLTFVISMKYVHPIVVGFITSTALLGFILERKDPGKTVKAYLVFMAVFITAAMVFFKMDIAKIGCNPDSFIQPHSLWHILNSFAVFYFYLYIRSENYKPEKDEKLLPFKDALPH